MNQEAKASILNFFQTRLFSVGAIFLILVVLLFRFKVHFNEMDVMPYARQVYNPNWLENDWYLNLKIAYRFLFSYPVGFLYEKLGFLKTLVIGRIVEMLLMAFALDRFFRAMKFNSVLFCLGVVTIYFGFFRHGNGAGEWMLGGLETKAIAYFFVIMSIGSALKQNLGTAFLFAGFALSFHLLVGIYHFACLMLFLGWNQWNFKALFKPSILFFIGGLVGVWGIVDTLVLSDSSLASYGWDIYVNKRVPNHVVPTYFPFELWIKLILFTIANVLILWKIKNNELKSIARYSLGTVGISAVGLGIYASMGSSDLLRFYFFRIADSMLPLLTIFSAIFLLKKWSECRFRKHERIIKLVFVAFCLFSARPALARLSKEFTLDTLTFLNRTNVDVEMSDWIKANTPTNSVFIILPDEEFFYVNFERAAFVSWKSSPQNAKDIEEWYHRIKLVSGNHDVETDVEARKYYLKINEVDVQRIKAQYPEVTHIIVASGTELDFQILKKTKRRVLHSIN